MVHVLFAQQPPIHNPCSRLIEAIPLDAFPTDAKIKRKKQKPVGDKTLDEDDGPGEHESNLIPLKPCKFIEDHYDDCGDDLTQIMLSTSPSLFSDQFEESNCFDSIVHDDMLDNLFSGPFVAWLGPGSHD